MPPDYLVHAAFLGSFQNDLVFRQAAMVAFHRCAQGRLFSFADESCESAHAKCVFARQHDPILAVLVKLCVEFDAQLDPLLCAREQLDAEPALLDSRWTFVHGFRQTQTRSPTIALWVC